MSNNDDGNKSDDSGRLSLGSLSPAQVRQSYLLKFIVATIIISVTIGAVGFTIQQGTSGALQTDVEQKLTLQTQSEADQLTEWLGGNQLPVRMISDHPVYETDRSQIRSYLQDQQETKLSDRVASVHYIDVREETIVASGSPEREGESVSDSPWISRLTFSSFDSVFVSEPYTTAENETVIAFISPVEQVINRAVVVTVDVGNIGGNFNNPIEGGFTRVVDSQGQVVFAQNQEATLSQYVENGSSEAVSEGLNGITGFKSDGVIEDQLSEEYVLAYAPVSGTDWVVVKHAPRQQAFEIQSTVENGILALLGVALIGVVAITATLGRNTATAVNALATKAKTIGNGNYDVEVTSSRHDEIGTLYSAINDMRDSLVTRLEEAERSRKAAEEAKETAREASDRTDAARQKNEELNEQLESHYSEVMAACAEGNLTRRMDAGTDSDAMAAIAESFNDMLDQWEQTIVEIKMFADRVESESELTNSSMRETREASSEVSQATRNITNATDRQRKEIDGVTAEMSNLSASIQEITSTAETVAESARQTADTGEEGQEAAETALEELSGIQQQANVSVETIENLDEGMGQIGEIVEFITDIAEQTNILALNANIEAARVGEAGSGFAVVAQEVKQLAEETQDAAAEIGAVIEDVQEMTNESVTDIRAMSESVEDGADTVEEALLALDEIAEEAEETDIGVQNIVTATGQQAKSAQEVATTADNLTEIADTTADEAEGAAVVSEEQSRSITQAVDSVEALSDHTSRLRAKLDKFEVDTADRD